MKLFVGAKGLVHYEGILLLLRESSAYIDGSEKGKWDVPGGRIESGEKVRDALVREVKEETGLEVTPQELLEVCDGFPRIRDEACHVVRLYFLCEAHESAVTLSQDHDAYAWVDPSDTADKELMADIAEMLDKAKKYL